MTLAYAVLATTVLNLAVTGVQAVPVELGDALNQISAIAFQSSQASQGVQGSAAAAEAEASTPLHVRQRREFNGSPASAMHELGKAFKSNNRFFPLAVTIVALLCFVVFLCIVKALWKCRSRSRSQLPQTTFDQVLDESSSFTRIFRRKRSPRQERPQSSILSADGTSFLAAVPEKTRNRDSWLFGSEKDADEMSEPLPCYQTNHSNVSVNSLDKALPSLSISPAQSLVEKSVAQPPKVLRKELTLKPTNPMVSSTPPRGASMPTRRGEQATLGVGSGRALASTRANEIRRSAYERVVTQ